MLRSLACGSAVTLGSVAIAAFALGFGDLSVHSSLGQPLDADIPLLSVPPGDSHKIKVAVPPKRVFEHAGVARSASINHIHLRVIKGENGGTHIHMSTNGPFRSPYLDLLLQISSPQGRVVREFTALINPPGESISSGQAASGPVSHKIPLQPAEAGPSAYGQNAADPSLPTTYGPVKRNETLWRVAQKLRPRGKVTQDQMVLAIYKHNREDFSGNINTLHAGAMLHVPAASVIASIDPAHAFEVVRQQVQKAGASQGSGSKETADPAAGAQGAAAARTASQDDKASVGADKTNRAGEDPPQEGQGGQNGAIRISDKVLSRLEAKAQQSSGNPFQAEPLPPEDVSASVPAANGESGKTVSSASETAHAASSQGASATDPTSSNTVKIKHNALTIKQSFNPVSDKSAANIATATEMLLNSAGAQSSRGGSISATATREKSVDQSLSGEAAAQKFAIGGGDATDAEKKPHAPVSGQVAAQPPVATESPAKKSDASVLPFGLSRKRVIIGLLLILLLLLLLQRRRRKQDRNSLAPKDETNSTQAATGNDNAQAEDKYTVGPAVTVESAELAEAEELPAAAVEAFAERQEDQLQAEVDSPIPDGERLPGENQVPDVESVLADGDFNTAYGLYDEALAGVRQGLVAHAGSHELKLKELEILFAAERSTEFLECARAFQMELAGDEEAWQNVTQMGRRLLPHEPLFRQDAGEPGVTTATDGDAGTDDSLEWPEGEALEGGAADNERLDTDDDVIREADRVSPVSVNDAPGGARHEVLTDDWTHMLDFEPQAPQQPAAMPSTSDDQLDIPAVEFDLPELQANESEHSATDTSAGNELDAEDEKLSEWSEHDWNALLSIAASPRPSASTDAGDDVESEEQQASKDADAADLEFDRDWSVGNGDDIETKLDLARAYLEMGDHGMALGLLDEVAKQGNETQRREAETLLEHVEAGRDHAYEACSRS